MTDAAACPGEAADLVDAAASAVAWSRSQVAERPTLGQVLDTLGPAIVSVLTAPAGRSVRVAEHLIVDTRDDVPPCPGAILLAVSAQPGGADTIALVRGAAEAQAGAVVVRTDGDDATELVNVAESAGIALLAADDRVSWRHLDSLLAAAINSAGPTEKQSLSAVAIGDLFALANAIAATVGGAIAIEGPQQRIMAYSNVPDQPIDEVRQLGILGRQVPYDPRFPAIYRNVRASQKAVRVTGVSPRDRLGVAVRAGADVLATIWAVEGDKPFSEAAERVLEDAARVTAIHLLRQRNQNDMERQARGELLRSLLQGRGAAESVQAWLRPMPERLVIVAFALPTERATPVEIVGTQVADLVTMHAQMLSSQAGCVLIKEAVYTLLPVTAATATHQLSQWANDVLTRTDASLHAMLRAGIGRAVTDVGDVPASRHDADQVLRVLARDKRGRRVATIDDAHAAAALLDLQDILSERPGMLLKSVGAILRHDNDKDTRYAATLCAYLDAFGDVAAAASEIHVHANTFRYRLRRIRELFGVDLDDPEERLVVWLQLRLLMASTPPTRSAVASVETSAGGGATW